MILGGAFALEEYTASTEHGWISKSHQIHLLIFQFADKVHTIVYIASVSGIRSRLNAALDDAALLLPY